MDVTEFLPNGFQLRAGKGGGDPKNGLCFMETVSLIAGEPISDHPDCACPILRRYGIPLNDRFDDATRQRLLPLAWPTAGTRSKEHERIRLEILGRAAIDCAKMVLPIFESARSEDMRARKAIEAAIAYWDNSSAVNRSAAAAAYADAAAADAAAAAAYAAYAAAAAAAADAAAAAAYAADAAATYAADKTLKNVIQDRAIRALRDAIEAGPNGGLPDQAVRARIDDVRDRLPVMGAA